MDHDMTLAEMLADPLIAQLREADAIEHAAFAQLMESASRVHSRKQAAREEANAFYRRASIASGYDKLN